MLCLARWGIIPANITKATLCVNGGLTVRKMRKTETTIELHETIVVRGSAETWEVCAKCAPAKAIMLGPEDAAVLVGIPPRIIYRWIEAGAIHWLENETGSVMVCLRSVLDASNGKLPVEGQPPQSIGSGDRAGSGRNSNGGPSE
jgi:hypothetical protein